MSEGQRFAAVAALVSISALVFITGVGIIVGLATGIGIRYGIAVVALGVSVLVNIINIVISVVEE